MSPRSSVLRLRSETVRRLTADHLEQARGGSIVQATTVIIRKTIETIVSANSQCASACVTDPDSCLCISIDCPTGG